MIKLIFSTLIINKEDPIHIQLQNHIIDGIQRGELKKGSKLPSTREVSKVLGISRNSVITAYEELESQGIIITKRGIGTFIFMKVEHNCASYEINYNSYINPYASTLVEEDIIKNELPYKRGMISFKSIAPEPSLFNMEDFKRALLDAYAYEGANLLNYGYAKGYRPLIDYLKEYMADKGVNLKNKDLLITNGFTEAFDLLISSLTTPGDIILCEKPTHNTALKIMKAHGIKVVQIDMDKDGINLEKLSSSLKTYNPKFAYLIPSYNNPTGIVTKIERRQGIYKLFKEYGIPIIEDGFNEELLYSSSPIEPLISLCGEGNGVIYLGSLSKVLFPGLRIGWILTDKNLIDALESIKRGRNIHSSFLVQGALYYFLRDGSFSKYIKNVRKYYRDKYTLIKGLVNKYIPCEYITGDGGLHIFIKLKNNINARELLKLCYEDGVIFMPGDIFYEDKSHKDTLRLGFGRLSDEDMEKGLKIIRKNLHLLSSKASS